MKIPSRLQEACALSLLLLSAGVGAAQPLPGLAASTDDVTVSGISSGGYMAVQFQVAYSGIVRGAGVVAGGPYYCAEGSLRRALGNCMTPSGNNLPPTAGETLNTVRQLAESGRIDPVNNLQDDRVWLLSGGNDRTVLPAVMDALDAFYRAVLPAAAISYVRVPEAGHAMLSIADPKANACPTTEAPFINRCQDFDAAGKLLTHLFGPLQPPATPPAGEVVAFDQRPFVAGRAIDASLANEGYVFVPANCRNGGCRIHVAFHGCRQNAGEIGRRFVRRRRLQRLGGQQPHHRALPADGAALRLRARFLEVGVQSERLLGLVGLCRRRLPHPRRCPDARHPRDDRDAGNARAGGTIRPATRPGQRQPLMAAVDVPICPIFKAHD